MKEKHSQQILYKNAKYNLNFCGKKKIFKKSKCIDRCGK